LVSTVPVGNPGNEPDPATGFGRVEHFYSIGKYEVTAGESYFQKLWTAATG